MPIGRSNVTRFQNGMTNNDQTNIFADMLQPDPTKFHFIFQDFNSYSTSDWTITKTGTGTNALTNGFGGILLVTNTAAAPDAQFFNKIGESFSLTAGKKAFFKARLKTSDASLSAVIVGLQVTDTTPLDATDGIYFYKASGAATVDIFVRKNATTGSNTVASITSMVSDTYMELAWFYDGIDKVYYAVDGVVRGSLSATSAYLPDTTLTLSFGIGNGEAVAKILNVDYLFAAVER